MENNAEKMLEIDLNADLGEGCSDDEAILACVSSANIACGGHAGDPASMRTAVRAAIRHGVAIGAHPSFPDTENFGRSEMHLPESELLASLRAQIIALREIVQQEGAQLSHVKPHGALYNQAARDPALAQIMVRVVQEIDPGLRLVALAGSELILCARKAGLAVAAEVFADRRYQRDGSLVARSVSGACIDDLQQALQQAMLLIQEKKVISIDRYSLNIAADTVCLHGDGAQALQLARLLRQTLEQENIQVRAMPRHS